MKPIRTCVAVLSAFAAASASGQGLVAYYQIGGDSAPWVKWDTYVVDSTSLVLEGEFIRYKSFRITVNGSDSAQELKADCRSRKRGLAGEASMYSTYDGTLSGEEVKAACSIAAKAGLVRQRP
jgi:hypothetical protein